MPALDLGNQNESTLNYQDQSRRLIAFDDLPARRVTLSSFNEAKKRRLRSSDYFKYISEYISFNLFLITIESRLLHCAPQS